MELKGYQSRSLERLGDFLTKAKERNPKLAFIEMTERPYVTAALPAELRDIPYVCVRVPTGGGKTFMATHAIPIAAKRYLEREYPLTVWLAPTNTIVSQTLRALKNPRHPYRQVLDGAFAGNVSLMTLVEALSVTPSTIAGSATVIVSTLAGLRTEDTDGRRVYEQNGALQAHFSELTAGERARLERDGDGLASMSLANVLRLHRPLVIADEAHNARTALSFEMFRRIAPAAIVEFTATPDQERNPSNVLCHVSALELKAEKMIKLPIRLVTREEWRDAVTDAIGKVEGLQEAANEVQRETGEYIRPIVLLQAQPRNETRETVTIEVLKASLIKDFRVPEDQIAVATGETDDLPDDILDPSCPVRFVLTVQKLREGWDCPFAYVLCSVSHISTARSVEQVLGRILRMPRAETKSREELNRAYAFVTSSDFSGAARSLEDALVESGFERFEAAKMIEGGPPPLFPFPEIVVDEEFEEAPRIDRLSASLRNRLRIENNPSGSGARVVYTGPGLTGLEERELCSAAHGDTGMVSAIKLARKSRGQPVFPAAMGVELSIPQLSIRMGNRLELFEDQFAGVPPELDPEDAKLDDDAFPRYEGPRPALDIDIDDRGSVAGSVQSVVFDRPLPYFGLGQPTPAALAVWLDRNIPHPLVPARKSEPFMREVIEYLTAGRGIPFEELKASQFRLRDAVERRLTQIQDKARGQAFLEFVEASGAASLTVDPSICFSFDRNGYPANQLYTATTFRNHYYERPGDMNAEEANCALTIDSLREIDVWVRNLERRERFSFWLPTSTDRFYPDFVGRLRDGRFLVVEYKGAHLMDTSDTREKKMVGELWQEKSQGKCLFLLVGGDTLSRIALAARSAR